MHLLYPLVLAALLFAVGVYGLLVRRNAVLVLMSVELMLNAVNLLLVSFDVQLRDTLHTGQTLALFVIVVAAAEVGLGLAIVLQVFRLRATVAVDELLDLAEPDSRAHPAPAGPPRVPGPTRPARQAAAVGPGGPGGPAGPGGPDGRGGPGGPGAGAEPSGLDGPDHGDAVAGRARAGGADP